MTEILTESFCERCGTRYTFETKAPRARGRGALRTWTSGLKNFVLSDETSLSDAMAAARSDAEREVTNQQLDAFHKTFNFCMSCRQYTCGNCWNETEGRCLTCAPHLGHEILPAPFPNVDPTVPSHAAGERLPISADAWPELDLTASPPSAEAVQVAEPAATATPPVVWEPALVEPAPVDDVAAAEPVETAAEIAAESPAAWEPASEVDAPHDVADVVTAVGPGDPVDVEPPAAWGTPAPEQSVRAGVEDLSAGDILGRLAGDAPVEVPPAATPETAAPEATEVTAVDPAAADAGAPATSAFVTPDLPPDRTVPEPREADAVAQVDDVAQAAAGQTRSMLDRFRPGESLDAELAAFESTGDRDATAEGEPPAEMIGAEAAPAEPVADLTPAIVEADVEPAVEVEPVMEIEPVAADTQPEPEPVAAAPELVEPEPMAPEPVAPAPEPVAPEPPVAAEPAASTDAPARIDRVEQPVWRIVAPDEPSVPDVGPAPGVPTGAPSVIPPAAPAPGGEPQWPTAAADNLDFLRRPRPDDAWVAASRELLASAPRPTPGQAAPAAIQSCVSCGLSLSATARFCRRCGTRQG